MKIVHVINNMSGGGAEKFLFDLAMLQSKEHDVTVLQLYKNDFKTYDKILNEAGVKVINFNKSGLLDVLNLVFQINLFLHRNKIDVVHTHLFPTQYIVALAKLFTRNRKTRFITTEHSTTNRRRDKWFLKWIERLIYTCYDSVVCVSHEAESTLRAYLQNTEVNIITIPNGVDIEAFKNAKSYPDFKSSYTKEESHLLIMTGRFQYPKDQETVIKAMVLIDKACSLLLVGDGINRKNCESLVKSMGMEDRVFFLGFRDDLKQIIKSCDIAIHSSDYEGLPLSIVEAMASGIPVIATRAAGITNLVEGAGLLFENKNHVDLAKQINHLISDKSFYTEVKNSCIDRAKQYDLQVALSSYMKIYNRV